MYSLETPWGLLGDSLETPWGLLGGSQDFIGTPWGLLSNVWLSVTTSNFYATIVAMLLRKVTWKARESGKSAKRKKPMVMRRTASDELRTWKKMRMRMNNVNICSAASVVWKNHI